MSTIECSDVTALYRLFFFRRKKSKSEVTQVHALILIQKIWDLQIDGLLINGIFSREEKRYIQGFHETLEMKFHDFSMTFYDQISNFP